MSDSESNKMLYHSVYGAHALRDLPQGDLLCNFLARNRVWKQRVPVVLWHLGHPQYSGLSWYSWAPQVLNYNYFQELQMLHHPSTHQLPCTHRLPKYLGLPCTHGLSQYSGLPVLISSPVLRGFPSTQASPILISSPVHMSSPTTQASPVLISSPVLMGLPSTHGLPQYSWLPPVLRAPCTHGL